MKVLYHSTNDEKSDELTIKLNEWGYELIHFSSDQNGYQLLEAEPTLGLILLDWQSKQFDITQFVTELHHLQHKHPTYVMLVGPSGASDELLKVLSCGAHDLFTHPLDYDLLKAKLRIGASHLTSHHAAIDSNNVLERYAAHIDRIAAERARQLFHAERLSTIGTMSASLAHEINNPICYISTSLETTKIFWERTDSHLKALLHHCDPEAQEAIEKILEKLPRGLERMEVGLQKITKLMSGLKNFARESQGEKVSSSLNDRIELALEMSENVLKYHVDVVQNLDDNLPFLTIDPQQIEQVLINLFVNAGHALEGRKDARLTITTEQDGTYITLTVEDNGPGIPPDKIESIWKPFYTTKATDKGTGLGLAISQNLIRDNGGTIEVTNGKSGGARFEIRFPII